MNGVSIRKINISRIKYDQHSVVTDQTKNQNINFLWLRLNTKIEKKILTREIKISITSRLFPKKN